ncbi:hypothetical protein cce_2012 [Crocosphaera subtropica ATCC 51142]|uniref:Uncharacterized protein n=1 Tax=Crocosphaera subtropica (strain ATCC 51142 / BH68) TaxID=43989 RepID=B1X1D3_CROS5|nr:hypothetical protein [Crocosphaera subtropica]ACB51362.1 hypothetical protein cce_2012 [Crocosphaera subtropica ATCC 51142]
MNQFSPEEQEIVKSFEADEWITQGTPERLQQLQLYTKSTDNLRQQITLNLSNEEIISILKNT